MNAPTGEGAVNYLNPDGLHQNPAFSQMVVVSGPVKTIYIGGQNAVNAAGEVVGKGDFRAQVHQIYTNLQTCLSAAGAGFEHVVTWSIFAVQGQPLAEGFAVSQEFFPPDAKPPAITFAFVAELANPDFLAEVNAIAVIPE